jgi:hypothetical protein
LCPIAWAMGKSGTPASTCQLAKVRRRSFGLQRSIPARPQASASQSKRLALEMLRTNRGYPAILKWLARVFSEMPGLTDEEAKEALDVLVTHVAVEGLQDVARILVFFAAFRAGHSAFPGGFDNTRARHLLEEVLASRSTPLRRAVSYTIYKRGKRSPRAHGCCAPTSFVCPGLALRVLLHSTSMRWSRSCSMVQMTT